MGDPCQEAVEAREICDPPKITTQSTTGGLCNRPGCDKKRGLKREGPGQLWLSSAISPFNELQGQS